MGPIDWKEKGEATLNKWLTRLLFAVAATFMLASCGGGGRGEPTIRDARIASHALVEMEGRKAANNAPVLTHPTSITQSLDSAASVSTTFDGTNVELTIDRRTGGDFTLNSATNSVTEPLYRAPLPSSPVSGHTFREWTLFDSSRTGTSTAYVTISWDNSDPTDYLAGGYWMHLSGDLSNESIASADLGAFIDGSEFSSAPTLPVLGTATYRGRASGLYTFYYGPGWQDHPGILELTGHGGPANGTEETGVYTGIATLTANFETNTISGCIGCMLPGEDPLKVIMETAGDILDPNGKRDRLYAIYLNAPGRSFARIRLGEAPIDSSTGTFTSSDVTLEVDYYPAQTGSTSQGTWGGKFSNIPDGSGDPRLVGGTTGAEWSNPEGGRAVFVGNFFAAKPQ